MDKPLIDADFVIQKIEEKGGWHFVVIPDVFPQKSNHFNWARVRGTIDTFEIRGYNLMPIKSGGLFLAIRQEIRKKIKKQAGDTIRVILYADSLPTEIPEELKECLKNEPCLYEKFMNYSEGEKKAFVDWIYSAKTDETKADRIVKTLEKVEKGIEVLCLREMKFSIFKFFQE
jgi:hypothetical protein